MSWIINQSNVIATSPPPGVKLPYWSRTRSRRALAHAGRALQVTAHNPRYLTILALAASACVGWAYVGIWAPLTAFLVGALVLTLWALRKPHSVRQAFYGWWRSNRRYRWTWERSLRRCHASKLDVPVPLLLRVRSTTKDRLPLVDKLRIKVPTGLDPTAFQDYRGELLKWGWRALSTRVYNPQSRRHTIELWNLINDPLIETVQPLPQPAEILPKQGLQMAMIEDGEWWRLKIRGNQAAHVYVCGISGSGKGSYPAQLLDRQLAAIQEGSVEAWGIDPQASELGMSRHLFKKLAFTRQDAANMLEELNRIADKRTRAMFGITRQHVPKLGDPFIELIVDEGLDLLDKTDRPLYRRIDTALNELLRKTRKASIRVSFIAQRAELEVVEIRKLFQIFIAFQLARDTDVDMVLGRGALQSGANAHDIGLPGICYIGSDPGIIRARFPYLSDEHIKELPPAPGNEKPENLPRLPGEKPVLPEMPEGSLTSVPESKLEPQPVGRLTDL